MRLLRRNTTLFEYLPNTGTGDDVNDDGLHTGEYDYTKGNPVTYRGNISMPSGSSVNTFYGLEALYTHTLVMDDPDVDIHEGGFVRWKGRMYDVVAVRPSLNAVSIALRQQTVNHAEVTNG